MSEGSVVGCDTTSAVPCGLVCVVAVDVAVDAVAGAVPAAVGEEGAPAMDVVAALDVGALAVCALAELEFCRKTTVSDPVFACWTCTSATKSWGRPHGSRPPGRAVPASWVTLPRKR
jgi:hypothetical protein